MADDAPLAQVGPRLRDLRTRRDLTLAQVSATTGVSVSTLSRLEQGRRRATLELLLPLARAYRVTLDDLVAPPAAPDPRVSARPVTRHGRVYVPLTQPPGAPAAYKIVIPPGGADPEPEHQVHEGYEWLYVLSGTLRLLLGEHDLLLREGEAAEFDTRTPHWLGNAGTEPVELLTLFGPQGERAHVRARPRGTGRGTATGASIATGPSTATGASIATGPSPATDRVPSTPGEGRLS